MPEHVGHAQAGDGTTVSQPLVRIEGLTVDFNGVRVVHGLDVAIAPGEALGIVGESGCGKSVTWLAALGLLPPAARVSGHVWLAGEDVLRMPSSDLCRVRGGQIAMIFQDPASALNPVIPVGRQIGEALALHRGLSGRAIAAEAKHLLDLVGLPDPAQRLNAYPHELSGGQNQRVMIAMALAGRPRLLVADEPTTALDATIQAQILDLLMTVRQETGMAIVLISHDLGVVSETCDRIMVMYGGRVVEAGPSASLFAGPQHPYTQGLLAALPPLEGARHRLAQIEGQVPDPAHMPAGCAFGPRCPHRQDRCAAQIPVLVQMPHGHSLACIAARSGSTALPRPLRTTVST